MSYQKNFDSRGFFATPFPNYAIKKLRQDDLYFSVSHTNLKHTIRGMHYQSEPYSEAKLLTVIQGSIVDVLIDLRPHSEQIQKIYRFNFTEERPEILYIPQGFAHGYQTLTNNTVILYALDAGFQPDKVNGISPLSADIMSLWPFEPSQIKPEDLKWPLLS